MGNKEYCNKCGAEIPSNSLFCNKCGEKIIIEEKKEEIIYDEEELKNAEEITESYYIDKMPTKVLVNTLLSFVLLAIFLTILYSNISPVNNENSIIEENNEPEPIASVENILPDINELKIKLKIVTNTEDEPDKVEQDIFDQAKLKWNYDEYDEAIILFNHFITDNKESVLLDDATYYLANSYTKQKEYNKGIEWYKKLIDEQPNSTYYAKACYELANIYYNNSDYKNEAMSYYIKVLDVQTLDNKELVEKSIKILEDYYQTPINIIYYCSVENCNNKIDKLFKYCTEHTCTKTNCENKKESNSTLCAEHIKKKSEGVSIGMTKQDVLDSSWGEPDDIRRTTYTFGVHEHWIYEGYNYDNSYLYFEDGILTTIQN